MAHGGQDIVVNRVPTVDRYTIHKLHGSRLSLEFPWPCSPWPHSPWWTAAPHSRLSTQRALLGVSNAETMQWHTDFLWPPFPQKALHNPQGSQTSQLHWLIPRSTGLSHQEHSASWRPGEDSCPGWYNLDLNSREAVFSKPLIENSFSLALKMSSTTNFPLLRNLYNHIATVHYQKDRLLLSFESSLYNLDMSPSSDTCFVKIFSLSVTSSHSLNSIFWRTVVFNLGEVKFNNLFF